MYNFGSVSNCSLQLFSEPNVEILRTVSNQTQKATNLTCYSEVSKSGCLVKKIVWTGPNGNTVSDAADRTLKGTIVSSTVVVNDRALEGLYNCTVHYAGGSAMTFYNYTGWSIVYFCLTRQFN